MSDIFVSYKAEDRARVKHLVDALQAEGLDVWWDAHISAGDDWREAIAANLEKARGVLVIWSKRSVGPDGRFVRDEAARAVKRGVYLPVTIDKVEPPLGFGETQCLPLIGWKGDREDQRYRTLLESARHVMSGTRLQGQTAARLRAQTGGVDRRALIAGGAVAAVAAAGGTGWYFLRATGANTRSVAVMPFANLSGDPAQVYFSDGLAEELRSALARINGLKVIGRTSSEAVRNDDAETAARKLSVGSILTGSVRRSSSTVRVSAQLVNGSDGVEKWSQTFDRPVGDVLQIQTNIAEAVVEQLRSQLGNLDRAALQLGGTGIAAALDLVLKADANVEVTAPALKSQIALYDAAISLDPNYAAAYSGKSFAQSRLAGYWMSSIDELNRALAESSMNAQKAIALAPDFADGHQALGFTRMNATDFRGAWEEMRRALQCPGVSPKIRLGIASFVSQMGSFQRALLIWHSAVDSDPLNPQAIVAQANIELAARRYGEAIPIYRRYLARFPDATGAQMGLVWSLLFAGRNAETSRELEKLPPDWPTRFVARAVLARRAGNRAGAEAILNEMRRTVGDNGAYQYAQMLADMGDRDAAIDELEKAARLRDPGFIQFVTDPLFDPLRSDPRFQAVLRQLNIPKI